MAAANLEATMVPLTVLERSVEALEIALAVAVDGTPNSVSDAGVAASCGIAAAEGASLNVRINLEGLEGDISEIVERHDAALATARGLSISAADAVAGRMADPPT